MSLEKQTILVITPEHGSYTHEVTKTVVIEGTLFVYDGAECVAAFREWDQYEVKKQ